GICLRGIRQMSMQAWPLDSLQRENESSVRDLPLVKQNFLLNIFISFYHSSYSPRKPVFLGLSFYLHLPSVMPLWVRKWVR
ncbi:MAG: hypothetical protein ACLR4F_03410, partial [Ruminococcus sp.]